MASNEHLKAYQQNAAQTPGYAASPQPGSPTYTEAWALIEAARRMAKVIENGISDDPRKRSEVRDALRLNWRLWTIFQSELTIAEESPVPDEIRMNMLTLCKFVDEHTVGTMADPTPEKVVVLIDMNRNIASGLLDSLKVTAQDDAQNAQAPQDTSQESNNAAPEHADTPAAPPPTRIDHEI